MDVSPSSVSPHSPVQAACPEDVDSDGHGPWVDEELFGKFATTSAVVGKKRAQDDREPQARNASELILKSNPKGTSRYKGVSWLTKHCKWRATHYCSTTQKTVDIGLFVREEDAARACTDYVPRLPKDMETISPRLPKDVETISPRLPKHVETISLRLPKDVETISPRLPKDVETIRLPFKRQGSTSRFFGVYWSAGADRWRARMGRAQLGSFLEEKNAARAYNDEARKLELSVDHFNRIDDKWSNVIGTCTMQRGAAGASSDVDAATSTHHRFTTAPPTAPVASATASAVDVEEDAMLAQIDALQAKVATEEAKQSLAVERFERLSHGA
jgi:hypothetical protein